jgi:hypothetical protein
LAASLTPADAAALSRVQPILLRSCLALLQRTLLAPPALASWLPGDSTAPAPVGAVASPPLHQPGPAAWLAVWSEAVQPLLQWCLPSSRPAGTEGPATPAASVAADVVSSADAGRWASLDGAQNVVGLVHLAVKAAIRLAEAGSHDDDPRGTIGDEAIVAAWSVVLDAAGGVQEFEAQAAAASVSGATVHTDAEVICEAITEALSSGCVAIAASEPLQQRRPLLFAMLRAAGARGVAGAAALADTFQGEAPASTPTTGVVAGSPLAPHGTASSSPHHAPPPPASSAVAVDAAAVDAHADHVPAAGGDEGAGSPSHVVHDTAQLPPPTADGASAAPPGIVADGCDVPSLPHPLPVADATALPPAEDAARVAAGPAPPQADTGSTSQDVDGLEAGSDGGDAGGGGSTSYLPSWLASWVGGR